MESGLELLLIEERRARLEACRSEERREEDRGLSILWAARTKLREESVVVLGGRLCERFSWREV